MGLARWVPGSERGWAGGVGGGGLVWSRRLLRRDERGQRRNKTLQNECVNDKSAALLHLSLMWTRRHVLNQELQMLLEICYLLGCAVELSATNYRLTPCLCIMLSRLHLPRDVVPSGRDRPEDG